MSKLKSASKISNLTQNYNPNEVEPYWQKVWEENGIYSPNLDTAKKPFDPSASPCSRRCGASLRTQGKPFYNLMMFPYPSAEGMHVGNMYAFAGADVYGRFKRMQGNDVFEPMGLDGFGIHSENYAIKVGQHPKELAKVSESNFYRQLRATGNGFDWSRKLETYDPKYYKWTQWLFIQLFKKGLAYRKKAMVNFCPSCKTVLADEQVIDGRCERCATLVVREQREQWFFRITHYAEKLLGNIENLNWSEKVKTAQRAWIGRSEGALITFKIKNSHRTIDVFTTRPDTLFGATFLVVSPEHPLVGDLFGQGKDVMNYLSKAVVKSEQERIAQGKEKQGVPTSYFAINPVNNQEIPIWIADYVLMEYGTGAIMAVPAHDQRDFEFAKKYNLPIKQVIIPTKKSAFADGLVSQTDLLNDRPDTLRGNITQKVRFVKGVDLPGVEPGRLGVSDQSSKPAKPTPKSAYSRYGILVNSEKYTGLPSEEAIEKIIKDLGRREVAKKEVTYHLRDWLISRQRYWGPPIPMIFCQHCANQGKSWFSEHSENSASQQIRKSDISDNLKYRNSEYSEFSEMNGWYPDEKLPVLLPDVKDWKPLGTGMSPLANHPEFYKVKCFECGEEAKRETDVSDTFLDSAWYFFRYTSTDIENTAFDIERVKKWLPVDMYIGGAEHSVLHLLYSRFITMVLKDLGFIEFDEPFSRFYAHGLLIKEGGKMSKSKGNVVVPDEYINKFGADALRMYLMFLGPFNQGGAFYDTGIEGMYRFVKRVWRLIADSCHPELVSGSNTAKAKMPKSIRQAQDPEFTEGQVRHDINKSMMHRTIKKVTEDISNLRYNTAIASLMEWHNYLSAKLKAQSSKLTVEEAETFLKLLAPFAPHVTEELWQRLKVSKAKKVSKVSNGKINPFGTFDTSKSFDTFGSVHLQLWPTYDPKFLEEDEITIVVQVDGKLRDAIVVQSSRLQLPSAKADGGQAKLKVKSYVEELARESTKIRKHLEGKVVKKVVYVEGKIINFVTDGG